MKLNIALRAITIGAAVLFTSQVMAEEKEIRMPEKELPSGESWDMKPTYDHAEAAIKACKASNKEEAMTHAKEAVEAAKFAFQHENYLGMERGHSKFKQAFKAVKDGKFPECVELFEAGMKDIKEKRDITKAHGNVR
jgi:hypothetical protein